MKPREMIRFLQFNGFMFTRSKGSSHHIYSKDGISLPIPIHGSKDLGEDLIKKILKEANINKNILYKWLGR